MKLKDFIDKAIKDSPMSFLDTAKKLVELEAIEQYLNLVFGIELDIRVKPMKPKEERFYGKGIIEGIRKDQKEKL